jgi:hypothetical protein
VAAPGEPRVLAVSRLRLPAFVSAPWSQGRSPFVHPTDSAVVLANAYSVLVQPGGAFQLRYSSFDIFQLNRFGRMIQHTIGSSYASRCRSRGIDHDFQQRCSRRRRGLLQPRNCLGEGGSPRLPVRRLKLWLLQPAHECARADSDGPRCFLHAPMREEGSNRFFLLLPEFCAVTFHLPTSAPTRASLARLRGPPTTIRGPFSSVPSELTKTTWITLTGASGRMTASNRVSRFRRLLLFKPTLTQLARHMDCEQLSTKSSSS